MWGAEFLSVIVSVSVSMWVSESISVLVGLNFSKVVMLHCFGIFISSHRAVCFFCY